MGSSVLIFGGIALAWAAYFVSQVMRRNSGGRVDAAAELASATPVFTGGDSASVIDAGGSRVDLSTPLTRRAELAEIRAIDRTAARRRRMFLAIAFGLVATVVILAATGYVPWWGTAVPGGLLLFVIGFNRFSVCVLRRQLDARFDAICHGHDEATVSLSRDADRSVEDGSVDEEASMDVTVSSAGTGTSLSPEGDGNPDLWSPLPVTKPTYVSKPLAPRTVRTIDLSPPVSPASAPIVPVTADDEQEPRAVAARRQGHSKSA